MRRCFIDAIRFKLCAWIGVSKWARHGCARTWYATPWPWLSRRRLRTHLHPLLLQLPVRFLQGVLQPISLCCDRASLFPGPLQLILQEAAILLQVLALQVHLRKRCVPPPRPVRRCASARHHQASTPLVPVRPARPPASAKTFFLNL